MKNTPRKTMMKLLSAALKGRDLEPEDLTAALSLMEALEAGPLQPEEAIAAVEAVSEDENEPMEEAPETVNPEEVPGDADPLADLSEKLDRVLELLTRLVSSLDEDPALTPQEEAADEEEQDPDLFTIAPGDEDPEPDRESCDRAIRAGIRALRPVIATLPGELQKTAVDTAVRAMRGSGSNPYAALTRTAARAAGTREIGTRIMKARNCNYKA